MPMDKAFALLRSHARDRNLRLDDVARSIIDGTLKLDWVDRLTAKPSVSATPTRSDANDGADSTHGDAAQSGEAGFESVEDDFGNLGGSRCPNRQRRAVRDKGGAESEPADGSPPAGRGPDLN